MSGKSHWDSHCECLLRLHQFFLAFVASAEELIVFICVWRAVPLINKVTCVQRSINVIMFATKLEPVLHYNVQFVRTAWYSSRKEDSDVSSAASHTPTGRNFNLMQQI